MKIRYVFETRSIEWAWSALRAVDQTRTILDDDTNEECPLPWLED